MARKATKQPRTQRTTGKRVGSQVVDELSQPPPAPMPTTARGAQAFLRRQAATVCGWCGGPIQQKAKGRIPKWCSASCRQRAWEQLRAAASGLAAVKVVERRVEVVAKQGPSLPPPGTPRHGDWAPVLTELAAQLDTGAIYDRDLPALTSALNDVLAAFARRPHVKARTGRATRYNRAT